MNFAAIIVIGLLELGAWLLERPWRFALLVLFLAVMLFRSWADMYVTHCRDQWFYAWTESVGRRR